MILADELCVVEIRIVGCQEENTGQQELVIDAVALLGVSIRSEYAMGPHMTHSQLFCGMWSMSQVYQNLARPRYKKQSIGYAPERLL